MKDLCGNAIRQLLINMVVL